MHFSAIALLSALSATVLAQSSSSSLDLSALPKCAQTCIGNGLTTTGCNSVDVPCICRSTKWISDLSCCVYKGCNAAEQNTTATFATTFCKTVGVTLNQTVGCSTSTTSTNSTGTTTNTAASTSATRNAAVGQTVGFGLAAAGLIAALL